MPSFNLDKIETRDLSKNKIPEYVVRGYATVPNHIYTGRLEKDKRTGDYKAFKEFFSEKALVNLKNKAKATKVFVDAMHQRGSKENVEKAISDAEKKKGIDLSEEKAFILSRLKYSDIPMFKVEDIKVDENGLFVDIRGNPFYRNVDEEHKNYFDSVWNSLQSGFINGMSVNFKPTSKIEIDGITRIDDIDLYGISLTDSFANDKANIAEVAMRSLEIIEVEECPRTKLRMML